MPRTAPLLLAVLGLAVAAGCSDTSQDKASGSSAPSSTPPAPSTSASIPTTSTLTMTPLPTPSKLWPTPKVTGAPDPEAPLAQRIRFAISKQAQIAAGRAATTTVNCPGIDDVEKAGQHKLTCTVTYSGKPYSGTLTVDAKEYSATYRFTSDSVAIVKDKVVDAVRGTVPGAAKVTCAMDAVAVIKHTDPQGIACGVTTVANAVQPYRAQVSGDGRVLVAKA
jgi:hypothetical protein